MHPLPGVRGNRPETKVGISQARGEREDTPFTADHLICPIGVFDDLLRPRGSAGQELAPAFTAMVNRLLWRHRALPSATLDKMRTKL